MNTDNVHYGVYAEVKIMLPVNATDYRNASEAFRFKLAKMLQDVGGKQLQGAHIIKVMPGLVSLEPPFNGAGLVISPTPTYSGLAKYKLN